MNLKEMLKENPSSVLVLIENKTRYICNFLQNLRTSPLSRITVTQIKLVIKLKIRWATAAGRIGESSCSLIRGKVAFWTLFAKRCKENALAVAADKKVNQHTSICSC